MNFQLKKKPNAAISVAARAFPVKSNHQFFKSSKRFQKVQKGSNFLNLPTPG